jgi:hypothetical protein
MIRIPTQATAADLRRELDVLEQRLDDGERRIEEATRIGADTEAWEEFWIELLHSYEAVYRRLDAIDDDPAKIAA